MLNRAEAIRRSLPAIIAALGRIGREGDSQGYIGIDGKVFYVSKSDVEERRELTAYLLKGGE